MERRARLHRAALVMGLALLLGCAKEEKPASPAAGGETSPAGEPAAEGSSGEKEGEAKPEGPVALTVIHAGIGVGTLHVLIDGKPLEGVEPFAPFDGKPVQIDVPSGSHLLAVGRPPRDEENVPPPLVTAVVDLEPASAMLLLVAGVYGKRGEDDTPLGLFLIPEAGGEAEDGAGAVRLVHGVGNAPPLDVSSRGEKGKASPFALVNVGFGKASAFHPVAAGPKLLEFRSGLDRDAAPIYVPKSVVLTAGERTTLLLLGKTGSRDHPLRLWALTQGAEVARSL